MCDQCTGMLEENGLGKLRDASGCSWYCVEVVKVVTNLGEYYLKYQSYSSTDRQHRFIRFNEDVHRDVTHINDRVEITEYAYLNERDDELNHVYSRFQGQATT